MVLGWCQSGAGVVLKWCLDGSGVVLGWYWDGARMVLGWRWDSAGVVPAWYWGGAGWCWDDAGEVLGWCQNDAGLVLEWHWGGAGMVLLPLPCAERSPHSPAAWSVWPYPLPATPCLHGTAQTSDRAGPAGHHTAAPEPCPHHVPMERMSWLSKLTPRGVGQRAARSASLQSPVTADPETCLMVFKNHWAQVSRRRAVGAGRPSGWALSAPLCPQVLRILERRGCTPAPDDLSAVRNNTYQLLNLLAEDRPRGDANAGPILEFVVAENLLERLLGWHLQGDFGEERKVEQLKLYEMLISQARQPLLRHRAVLTPLLRLLSLCAEPTSAPLENSLVLLLNQLCVSVAKEPAILELFFHSHTDQGPANLIIFSLLIPFIHHEGVLGQQARDALLLIMAMSASNHAVAKSITDNSYFCPVRLVRGWSCWLLYAPGPPRSVLVPTGPGHGAERAVLLAAPQDRGVRGRLALPAPRGLDRGLLPRAVHELIGIL